MLVRCDTRFIFGCHHAVVENIIQEHGVNKVQDVMQTCRESAEASGKPYLYSMCAHGVGHGLASWSGLNNNKSLQACDTLLAAESEDARRDCYDGVFMEYYFDAPSSVYNIEKPWQVCTQVDEKYHSGCGNRLSAIFRDFFGYNLQETLNVCLSGPNETLRTFCVGHAAFNVSQMVKGDAEKIIETCSVVSDIYYRDECIAAAAAESVRENFPNRESELETMCAAMSTKSLQEKCRIRNTELLESGVSFTRMHYWR
jgi:hypothetical protein